MTSVWKAVAKHNGLSVQQLGSVEMVELDRFICGLTSSELRQLDLDHFKLVPLRTSHSSPHCWTSESIV